MTISIILPIGFMLNPDLNALRSTVSRTAARVCACSINSKWPGSTLPRHRRLSLVSLAAIAGSSPHHVHRVFSSVTGEAPEEYLRRLRFERVVYRLKARPDNVLRIALESGFATPDTCTRAVVRRFGISRSEFRAVLRGYRECVEDAMESPTFAGFTERTPLFFALDLLLETLRSSTTTASYPR